MTGEPLRVLRVIVTYHPTQAQLSRIVDSTHPAQCTLIVDNSTLVELRNAVASFCCANHVHVLQNIDNPGIARAINQAAAWGKANEFECIVTFDQDSEPMADAIAILKHVADVTADEKIVVIGSNIQHGRSNHYSAGTTSDEAGKHTDADVVLISGAWFPIDTFLNLGGLREDFFMDLVDVEFCWRAQQQGYKVIQALKPGLIHGAGNAVKRSILRREAWALNHQPYRYYHLARNSMVLNKLYPQKAPMRNFLRWLLRIAILEPQPLEKIRQSILGVVDGLKARRHEECT